MMMETKYVVTFAKSSEIVMRYHNDVNVGGDDDDAGGGGGDDNDDDQVPRRQGEDTSGCLHCALNVSLAALSDYKGRPRWCWW